MRTSVTVAMVLAALGSAALAATPAAAGTSPPPFSCLATVGHAVAPSHGLLGEPRLVSVHFEAVCASEPIVTHVVFAIGSPQAMTAQERRDAHDAAQDLAEHFIADDSGLRIGVVGQHGAMACNPSRNLGVALHCLDRAFDPAGPPGPRASVGILPAAGAIMRRARLQNPVADPREIVILLSASPEPSECPAWLKDADSLKRGGLLVITLCVGRPCASHCLGDVATSPRYAFELHDYTYLYTIARRIRGLQDGEPKTPFALDAATMMNISLKSLVLEYPLSAGVAYVADTLHPVVTPEAGSYDPANHRIAWRTTYVPREGVTITFQVQPLTAGAVEMRGATFRAIDTYNRPLDVGLVTRNLWTFGEH